MFNKINIVPRWIIFLIDVICCVSSLCFAYFIRFNLNIELIDVPELSRNLLIFTAVNAIVFLNVKTYAGIIRYTSAQDSFRILFSILISNSLFFFANLVFNAFNHEPVISNVVLIINGLSSFLLLITYRVMIKYFFLYIKNMKIDKRRVVIYGAGETGIAVKRTLDHDPKVNMHLICFVDDDDRKTNKVIDGAKIFHASDLHKIIQEEKIDDLIIAAQTLPAAKKNVIVDFCLEHNVKVLTLPPVQSWINGQISTRQLQNIKIEDLLERESI